jgi:hypothetical protein
LLAENSPIMERDTGARESERERERDLLTAGSSPILGKEMAEERERAACLLKFSNFVERDEERERDLLPCWIFSNYRERDGGRHSERGPEGKTELLAILQFWRERLQRQRDLCL